MKLFVDSSSSDLVLFEAASLLKTALIREWNTISQEDVKSLRVYLLTYVVQRATLPTYVRERILQVVAIIVKRASVEDLGADRGNIMNEVEHLFINGNKMPLEIVKIGLNLTLWVILE